MKLTLHRIPRLRALGLFLIGFLAVIIIIGVKMCHDKYVLYREFERQVVNVSVLGYLADLVSSPFNTLKVAFQ